MPTFAYTAVDRQGRAAAGTMVADTSALARQRLEAGGMRVRSIDAAGGGPVTLGYSQAPPRSGALPMGEQRGLLGVRGLWSSWIGTISQRGGAPGRAVTAFYRDLAVMLDAGIGIRESLATMRQQAASVSPTFFNIVSTLHDHVAEGGSLAEAMAQFPEVFEPMEVRAIAAGELAGLSDESLRRLADLRERRHRLKQRVITAMTYPTMVLGIATVITVLLMTFVVPIILEPLLEAGRSVPLPTRIVKAASDMLLYAWWLLLATAVVGIFLLRWWIRTPAGRRTWDTLVLKVPVFGGLVLKHALARAATVIATMLRCGIGFVEALRVAQTTCDNAVLREGIGRWEQGVDQGLEPHVALARAGAFPAMMVEMVAIGAQSGKMEDTLDKLSQTYEEDVENTSQRVAALVEPALVLFLAGVILLIILAVFLPYLEILTWLGG